MQIFKIDGKAIWITSYRLIWQGWLSCRQLIRSLVLFLCDGVGQHWLCFSVSRPMYSCQMDVYGIKSGGNSVDMPARVLHDDETHIFRKLTSAGPVFHHHRRYGCKVWRHRKDSIDRKESLGHQIFKHFFIHFSVLILRCRHTIETCLAVVE